MGDTIFTMKYYAYDFVNINSFFNRLTKLGHKLSPFEYKHARPLEDFLEKK